MKPPFYPLFKHILESSVWCGSPPSTKFVWVALLDLADYEGSVFMTLPELAHLAGVTVPEAEAAIERLLAADSDNDFSASSNGEHVEVIPGGWRVFPASYGLSEVGI
jgi:hypothetical protein